MMRGRSAAAEFLKTKEEMEIPLAMQMKEQKEREAPKTV